MLPHPAVNMWLQTAESACVAEKQAVGMATSKQRRVRERTVQKTSLNAGVTATNCEWTGSVVSINVNDQTPDSPSDRPSVSVSCGAGLVAAPGDGKLRPPSSMYVVLWGSVSELHATDFIRLIIAGKFRAFFIHGSCGFRPIVGPRLNDDPSSCWVQSSIGKLRCNAQYFFFTCPARASSASVGTSSPRKALARIDWVSFSMRRIAAVAHFSMAQFLPGLPCGFALRAGFHRVTCLQ